MKNTYKKQDIKNYMIMPNKKIAEFKNKQNKQNF